MAQSGERQPRRQPSPVFKAVALLLAGLLIGAAAGAVILWRLSGNSAIDSRRLPPTVGSPVKDFTLDNLDGQPVRMKELRGQPVVINFWATWCAPCKEEMPLLSQYAERYASQMVVLGVNSGETEEQVRPFLAENPVSFPILMDQTTLVSDTYYARSFPITFFVDAEGVLRAQHLGMLDEKLLARYLETIGVKP